PAAALMGAEYASLGASAGYAFQSSSGGALARITQAQNGGAAMSDVAPAPPPTPDVAPAGVPSPASWSAPPPRLEPAIARAPDRFVPPGSSPDVFGSVALRISHTALDARWSHVADAPPPSDARWRQAVSTARALPDHARLSLANSWL